MASLSKDGKGWRIRFYDGAGKRGQVRLSGLTKAKASEIRVHVAELNSAKISGMSIDRATALWLGKIGDALYGKLAAAGLVSPREDDTGRPLADSLEYHIKRGKTKTGRDAAGGTLLKWQAAARHLNSFFADRSVESITVEDAEAFRDWLGQKTVKKTGNPYSENNIRSVISSAKMFFHGFQRRKWVTDNPFAHEVSGTQENRDRLFYVTREATSLILDVCPDPQWQLMFALWRLAALRKMEVWSLKWSDVLWSERMLRVTATKTAHHASGGERLVPIAEILPYLERVFEEAEDGAEMIITRYSKPLTNLDKPFRQIIERAGLSLWPKLFQNLRSSCETDWLDWVGPDGERNSAHVVASWVGHSIKIQHKHYAQVDRHHFDNFNDAVIPQNRVGVSSIPDDSPGST